MNRRQFTTYVLLVTALGAGLRLIQFGSVPAGLYQDEAFNGLDALRVLAGEHALYFTTNNGREPLLIYLVSLGIAWLGRTPQAVRLPALLLGTLTIPATALLGSSLFNRRVGILSAFVVAGSFWTLHLSRVGFRAVGLPLFTALALAAGWHGARRAKWEWMVLGGICYGLGFYTYLAVRATPIVLFAWAAAMVLAGHWADLWRTGRWFVLAAALVVTPLLAVALSDPAIMFGRVGQVSILGHGNLAGALIQNLGRGLGLYVWQGDVIPRHNLPGRPVFDLIMAFFFLIGLAWLVKHRRRPAAMLTLLWSFLMLAPTILAEDTPHFLRAVGVLPLAMVIPALGLDQSWQWMERRRQRGWLAPAMAATVLSASLAWTAWDYWGNYARQPITAYAFQSAAVEMAEQIDDFDGPVWASERFVHEWEAIPLMVESTTVHWIAEDADLQIDALPALLLVWPYHRVADLMATLPSSISLQGWRGPLIKGDLEDSAYPLYWGYLLESDPGLTGTPLARFSNGMTLDRAAASGDGRSVTLEWTIAERADGDYTVFVHVTGRDGIVAQDDSRPAAGTYPTQWWRPGDRIVDLHAIPMPVAYDHGLHQTVVGLYHSETRERVAVLAADGTWVSDHVILPADRPGG